MEPYETPFQRQRRQMLPYIVFQVSMLGLLLLGLIREHRPADPIAASGLMDMHTLPSANTNVPAGDGWVPVGIILPAERVVAILAEGSLTLDDTAPVSAEGAAYTCGEHLAALEANERGSNGCLLLDAPYGALIGQVDNGEPFLIGEFGAIVLRKAGPLSLAINTCCVYEASGAFAVHVSVTPFHHEP